MALQGAGLVNKQRRRGTHRRRRPRRPLPGMLLHIDASRHAWFGDGRYYDLITILDNATSEIYYTQLVEEEGTRTLMPAVREVIEQQGIFCALYSDRDSHFFVTPKAGGKVDESQVTQLLHLPRVDFIKMDIEGAEREALRGASRTLARDFPRLMLDSYHRLDDMQVLPAIIRQANPHYSIHCGPCEETLTPHVTYYH